MLSENLPQNNNSDVSIQALLWNNSGFTGKNSQIPRNVWTCPISEHTHTHTHTHTHILRDSLQYKTEQYTTSLYDLSILHMYPGRPNKLASRPPYVVTVWGKDSDGEILLTYICCCFLSWNSSKAFSQGVQGQRRVFHTMKKSQNAKTLLVVERAFLCAFLACTDVISFIYFFCVFVILCKLEVSQNRCIFVGTFVDLPELILVKFGKSPVSIFRSIWRSYQRTSFNLI